MHSSSCKIKFKIFKNLKLDFLGYIEKIGMLHKYNNNTCSSTFLTANHQSGLNLLHDLGHFGTHLLSIISNSASV